MITEVLARIEQRLVALGLSATAASTQAGLNRDAIRNIRRAAQEDRNDGRLGVQPRTLAALAKVLQTTPGWLLTGKDELADQPASSAAGASSLPYVEWDEAAEYLEADKSFEGAARRARLATRNVRRARSR